MRMKQLFFTLGLAVTFSSCKNPLRQLERKTILGRMWSLASFSGVYTETGLSGRAQRTKIAWRAEPAAVLARSAETGDVLHYGAGTLSAYYPQATFGIRYRHLTELKPAEQMQWLENEYDWHVANYDISQIDDGAIAGYETVGLRYFPNAEFSRAPFSFEWRAAVQADYAFALETAMYKNNKEKYRIRFEKIEFQKALLQTDLDFRFPANATIAEYDFDDKPLTLAAVNRAANFRLKLPAEIENFKLKKIIRAKGLIPAFTCYFENLPYQTFYTQVKDYGLKLFPDRGLLIEGIAEKRGTRRQYRVNFAGAFRTISFLEGGVYHAVVTSKPLSEALAWLDN